MMWISSIHSGIAVWAYVENVVTVLGRNYTMLLKF